MHKQRDRARLWLVLACLVGAALIAAAAQQATQQQQQEQQKKDQKDQKDKKEAKPEEKKGGLFGGMKAVTATRSSNETELTASAGAKGVGEGDKIGKVKVTAEDRQKVEHMAAAKPSATDLKAFLQEGKLATERKGGS